MTNRDVALSWRFDLALPCVVAFLGLASSLLLTLLAPPGTLRVAVLAVPGLAPPWTAIDRSGLPVVQVMLGGFLVVVEGSARPDGLSTLRAANLVLLDASGIPGCASARTVQKCASARTVQKNDKDYGSDT